MLKKYRNDYLDISFSVHKIKDRKVYEILKILKNEKEIKIKDWMCNAIINFYGKWVNKDGE